MTNCCERCAIEVLVLAVALSLWGGTVQLMVRVIRIIGSKRKEGREKPHNGQLHNLHSLPNTWTYHNSH